MEIMNRITGELLEEEIERNQKAYQPEDPTSEPMNGSPPKSGRRKKSEPESGMMPHTMLHLIETLQEKLDKMQQLNSRSEALLKQAEETINRPVETTTIPNRTSDLPANEIAAELTRIFDDGCKKIVDQRLSDALKESERICDRLSRKVSQTAGIRRLLITGLILSGINLTAVAALLITLWLH